VTLANWSLAAPELLLAAGAVLLLMLGVFLRQDRMRLIAWLSVAVLVVTIILVGQMPASGGYAFGNLFVVDRFSQFMKIVVLSATGLSILLSMDFAEREQMGRFEFPVLMLFATLGMMVVISANDLFRRRDFTARRALWGRRLPARFPALDGGGAEVFRPRLAVLGHAALRRLDDLWLRRHHGLPRPGGGADRFRGRARRAHHRPRLRAGRPRLQGLGGALPYVDAGRL
jgi:hypothetical protein